MAQSSEDVVKEVAHSVEDEEIQVLYREHPRGGLASRPDNSTTTEADEADEVGGLAVGGITISHNVTGILLSTFDRVG